MKARFSACRNVFPQENSVRLLEKSVGTLWTALQLVQRRRIRIWLGKFVGMIEILLS